MPDNSEFRALLDSLDSHRAEEVPLTQTADELVSSPLYNRLREWQAQQYQDSVAGAVQRSLANAQSPIPLAPEEQEAEREPAKETPEPVAWPAPETPHAREAFGTSFGILTPEEGKAEVEETHRNLPAQIEEAQKHLEWAKDELKAVKATTRPGMLGEDERLFHAEYTLHLAQTAYDDLIERQKHAQAQLEGRAPLPTKGRTRNAVENLVQGAAGFVTESGKGAGIIGGAALNSEEIGPDKNVVYRWSQWAQQQVEQWFPGDPARQQETLTKAAQMLGFLVPAFATGLVSAGAKTAATKYGAKAVEVHALGSAGGVQQYEAAKKAQENAKWFEGQPEEGTMPGTTQVTDLDALKAFLAGYGIGAAGTVPLGKTAGAAKATTAAEFVEGAAKSATTGGAYMAGFSLANDAIARGFYDPTHPIGENLGEDAALGALFGGLGHSVAQGIQSKYGQHAADALRGIRDRVALGPISTPAETQAFIERMRRANPYWETPEGRQTAGVSSAIRGLPAPGTVTEPPAPPTAAGKPPAPTPPAPPSPAAPEAAPRPEEAGAKLPEAPAAAEPQAPAAPPKPLEEMSLQELEKFLGQEPQGVDQQMIDDILAGRLPEFAEEEEPAAQTAPSETALPTVPQAAEPQLPTMKPNGGFDEDLGKLTPVQLDAAYRFNLQNIELAERELSDPAIRAHRESIGQLQNIENALARMKAWNAAYEAHKAVTISEPTPPAAEAAPAIPPEAAAEAITPHTEAVGEHLQELAASGKTPEEHFNEKPPESPLIEQVVHALHEPGDTPEQIGAKLAEFHAAFNEAAQAQTPVEPGRNVGGASQEVPHEPAAAPLEPTEGGGERAPEHVAGPGREPEHGAGGGQPGTTGVAEPRPAAASAPTPDERARFDAILADKAPRSEWAGRLGVDDRDLERYIADGLERGVLRERNGKVFRAPRAKETEAVKAQHLPEVRPNIADKLRTGEVRKTATGRDTTPAPVVDWTTPQRAKRTLKRIVQWLMQNALDEAQARGDDYNAQHFEADLQNSHQAQWDAAEHYLFNPESVQPIPQPILKPLPKGPPQWALDHAKDFAGDVAWHDGDLALIRGFSLLNGKPNYHGAKEGLGRTSVDIDSYRGEAFTREELAKLRAAKAHLVAEDEAAHEINPDGPFAGKGGFAASPSVPKELAGYAQEMLRMLDVRARVYLTTVGDARGTRFNGPFAAIGSAGVDEGSNGSTRRLSNGDHYIAINLTSRQSRNIEVVAHEMGHILEKEEWEKANEETRAAVEAEYQQWKEGALGGTKQELVDALRPHSTAKSTQIPRPEAPAKESDYYWSSFGEWFADNVARWATSSEKPLSVAEKFFKRLAAALRKFYESLAGKKWLPAKSLKDWLDSLAPIDPREGGESAPSEGKIVRSADEIGRIGAAEQAHEQGASPPALPIEQAPEPQPPQGKGQLPPEQRREIDIERAWENFVAAGSNDPEEARAGRAGLEEFQKKHNIDDRDFEMLEAEDWEGFKRQIDKLLARSQEVEATAYTLPIGKPITEEMRAQVRADRLKERQVEAFDRILEVAQWDAAKELYRFDVPLLDLELALQAIDSRAVHEVDFEDIDLPNAPWGKGPDKDLDLWRESIEAALPDARRRAEQQIDIFEPRKPDEEPRPDIAPAYPTDEAGWQKLIAEFEPRYSQAAYAVEQGSATAEYGREMLQEVSAYLQAAWLNNASENVKLALEGLGSRLQFAVERAEQREQMTPPEKQGSILEPEGGAEENAGNAVRDEGEKPLETVASENVPGDAEGGNAAAKPPEGKRRGRKAGGAANGRGRAATRGGRNRPARGNTAEAGGGSSPGTPEEVAQTPSEAIEQASPPNVPAVDFAIDAGLDLGKGTEGEKYQDNIDAIRTLKQLELDGRRASPDEQRVLARYVGWGGLANAFKAAGSKEGEGIAKGWEKRVAELEELLTPAELRAARNSTKAAHYTSEPVVRALWRAVERIGYAGGSVLEPAMGTGNFFGLMPPHLRGSSQLFGVEYDSITARIAKMLYPNAAVVHSGLENVPLPQNQFALAIGNPPFGKDMLTFRNNPGANGYSIHNQFFIASLDALAPGGVMGMVVSHYLMDALDNSARVQMAKRARFLGAIRLPDTAFKENARTDVVTDLMFFQKRMPEEHKYDPANLPEKAREAAEKLSPVDEAIRAALNPADAGIMAISARGQTPEYKRAYADVSRWLNSSTISDPSGNSEERVNLNNYFLNRPKAVVGRIDASGKMQGRRSLNVKLDDPTQFERLLNEAIDRLPKAEARPDIAQQSLQYFKLMVDGMRLAVERAEPGSISRDADGKLKLVVDIDADERGKSIMAEIELTPDTPFRPEYTRTLDGKWRRTVDKLDEAGNKIKVVNEQGKTTNRNVKEVVTYDNEKDIPAGDRWGRQRVDIVEAMLPVRNLIKRQLILEAEDAPQHQLDANRERLNQAYDAFVKAHGGMHGQKSRAIARSMPDGALALAVEEPVKNEKTGAVTYRKSDIMSKRVTHPPKPIERVANASDAVAVTLSERGRIEIERVAKLLGTDEAGAEAALSEGENPRAFYDPETQRWEPADIYLSGLVRKKLNAARAAGLEKNVAALEKVQPEPWNSSQVTPNLGSPWLPTHVIADFLKYLGYADARVEYSALTHTYSVVVPERSKADLRWETSKDALRPSEIVSRLLNSQGMKCTEYDPQTKKTYVLQEETTESQQRAAEISNEFLDWAFADSARRNELVRIANERYNNRLIRQYDGSHLQLPGKVPDRLIKMRRHQMNAIWRGIVTPAVLYDHVVGSGKTFTAIARAMERRRMGLSRKPMIVVPNHLVEQWAADVKKLYPAAHVLAATKADFEPENRRRLFTRIAAGDYDLTIIGHSSFGFIDLDPATEERYLNEALREAQEAVLDAWDQAREDGMDNGRFKPMGVKEAERLVTKLENRLASMKKRKRDRLLTWEEMGVDDLTIDEAHEFKNLSYSSRLTGVAGMGNKTGSQKAMDLHLKIRSLNERPGTSVAFLTGTPVSNSVAEMYLVLRNLAPQQLKEMGMENFDAWRSMFVSATAAYEPTEASTLKEVTRLGRAWSNMRSLMDLYYSVADCVTQEDVAKAYEEDNPGRAYPVPKTVSEMKGGGVREKIAIKPTPEQERLLQIMLAGFEGLPHIKDPYERNKERLRLMDMGRKISLDPRAVDPHAHIANPLEGGKIVEAVSRIAGLYKKWDHVRGTQLVFLDRSVPKAKGDDKIIKAYDDLQRKLREAQAADDVEAIQRFLDDLASYNPNEIAELRNAQMGGWNAYEEIKRQLVTRNIPADEIRFVQEANTDAQKKALFDLVKEGKVRVLIGSTPRMGAGTNVQDRLIGLHHIDVTWKPSDIEQREGRIIRQGNIFVDPYLQDGSPNPDFIKDFAVEILAYATERTTDAKMWSINSDKLKAINGLRKYNGEFEMEFEDSESVSMAEMAALATGNPLMVERVMLQGDIDKLELQQRSRNKRIAAFRDKLEGYERDVVRLPERAKEYEEFGHLVEKKMREVDARSRARKITIDGKTYKVSDHWTADAVWQETLSKIDAQKGGDENARFSLDVDGKKLANKEKVEAEITSAIGTAGFEADFNGQRYVSFRDVSRAIAAECAKQSDDTYTLTGLKVNGIDAEVDVAPPRWGDPKKKQYEITVAALNSDSKTIFDRSQTHDGEKVAAHAIWGRLQAVWEDLRPENFLRWADNYRGDVIKAKKEIPGLRQELAKPWEKLAELEQKRTRLQEVVSELAQDPRTARLQAALQEEDPGSAVPAASRGRDHVEGGTIETGVSLRQSILVGKPAHADPDAIEFVLDVLHSLQGSIPPGVEAAGVVRFAEPWKNGQVRLHMVGLGGVNFSTVVDRSFAASADAFYLPEKRAIALTLGSISHGFSAEQLRVALGGKVWHELLHFGRITGRLTLEEWERLVDHAKSLRLLDLSPFEWHDLIGSPHAKFASRTGTVRDAYELYYKDCSEAFKAERIDQEEVAFAVELLAVMLYRDPTDPQRIEVRKAYAEVADIYSDLLSGDVGRRDPYDVNVYDSMDIAPRKISGEEPAAPSIGEAPENNPEIKSLTEIIANLKDALGLGGEGGAAVQGRRKFSVKGVESGKERHFGVKPSVAGQYDTATGAARYKLSTDIETIAHEGGHHLERVFGDDITSWKDAHRAELEPMAYEGAKDELSEGFAEFFSRYITDDEALRAANPELVKDFEEFLDKHDPKMLQDFDHLQIMQASQSYREYRNATTLERARADSPSYAKAPYGVRQFLKDAGQADTWSGWFAMLFEGFCDRNHPDYMLTRELLKLQDLNREPGEKPVSIPTHENPYKIRRALPDAYKAGLAHLQRGMPYYQQQVTEYKLVSRVDGRTLGTFLHQDGAIKAASGISEPHAITPVTRTDQSRSAAPYDALTLACGKKWDENEEGLADFNVYLEMRRFTREWDNWNEKQAKLNKLRAQAEAIQGHISLVRKSLRGLKEKLGRRENALQRESALLMDAQRREVRSLRREDDEVNYQQFAGGPLAEERANRAAIVRREEALRRLEGRYDEAQRLYDQALKRDEAEEEYRARAPGLTPIERVNANQRIRSLRATIRELDRRMSAIDEQRDDIEAEIGELAGAAQKHLTPEERQRSAGRSSEIQKEITRAQSDIKDRTARRDRLRQEIAGLTRYIDNHTVALDNLIEQKAAVRNEYKATKARGYQDKPHRIKKDEQDERIRQLEAKYPTFPEAAKMIYDFLWRAAVFEFQIGKLSKSDLDNYEKRKDYYVPAQRDLRDVDTANPKRNFMGMAGRRLQKDKRSKGSDRNVYRPIETIVDQAFHRVIASHMNDWAKAVAKLVRDAGPGGAAIAEIRKHSELMKLDPGGYGRLKALIAGQGYDEIDAERIASRIADDWADTHLYLSTTPEPNVGHPFMMPLWENGERNAIEFRDPEWARAMFRSLSALPQTARDIFYKTMEMLPQFLQTSVWTSPAFQAVHALRVSVTAWYMSENPADPRNLPIIGTIRGARHHMLETPFARLYREAGGPTGGIARSALNIGQDAVDVRRLRRAGIRYNPWTIVPAMAAGAVSMVALTSALGVPAIFAGGAIAAGAGYGAALHRGPGKMLETLRHFSDFFEDATRLNVAEGYYKAALKNNPSLTPFQAMQEAQHKARDVFDGNRMGSQMMTVSRTMVFERAHQNHVLATAERFYAKHDRGLGVSLWKMPALQATAGLAVGAAAGPFAGIAAVAASPLLALSLYQRSSLVRKAMRPGFKHLNGDEMSDDERRAVGDSMKMIWSVAMWAFLVWLTSMLLNYGDEQTKREYEMFSAKFKEKWQPLKVGNTWIRLPNIFQFSVLQVWLNAAYDAQTYGDPRMVERMLEGLYEGAVPPFSSPTYTVPLGMIANYNFFTGRPIVNDKLQHRSPQMQYDATSSEFAKLLGQNLGLSPKMIDFALTQSMGYWGRDIQALSNTATKPAGLLSQFPLIGSAVARFQMDPYKSSEAKELFWKKLAGATSPYPRAVQDYKANSDEKEGGSPAAGNAYLANLPQDLRTYVLFQTQRSGRAADMHPLKRATDITWIGYHLQRELSGDGVSLKATGKVEKLGPVEAEEVKETLEQLSAIEMHNAWVEVGEHAMAGKREMPVQPTLDAFKKQSPAIAAEYEERLARAHVQPWSYVKESWRAEAGYLNMEWQAAADRGEAMPNLSRRRR